MFGRRKKGQVVEVVAESDSDQLLAEADARTAGKSPDFAQADGGYSPEEFAQVMSLFAHAQKAYDDRMLRLAKHAANWQRMSLLSWATTVVALGLAFDAYHQPRLQGVLVSVDRAGTSTLVSSDEPTAAIRSRQELRETIDFIENCRTVVADKMGQRLLQTKCYSRLPDKSPAREWILAHETGPNDPVLVGQDHSVEVTVTNPLKISSGNWEVEWQEQSILRNGQLSGPPVKYKAHLSDQFLDSNDVKSYSINPSGYYVQTLSWAQTM